MNKSFYLIIVVFFCKACSPSTNSTSPETVPEVEEALEESVLEVPLEETTAGADEASVDVFGPVDPTLLAAEPEPYRISSFFKFYSEDLEEAERVLASTWDPDASPGAGGDYDDKLELLDERNGYMKVVSPVADGFLYTEYVYWNLSAGRKLFAMNKVGMEPFTGEVTTEAFEFRTFHEGAWERVDLGLLMDLTQLIDQSNSQVLHESELLNTMFDMPEALTSDNRFSYQMHLPQRGKDIRFILNHSEAADVIAQMEVTLFFSDGTFEYQP